MIGAIGGMAVGDVTWTYDAAYDHPLTITATMTPPMAPGAFFRFGADTDFFVSDPCPGGNFGTAGASAKVVYTSGVSDGDVFTTTSALSSEVVLGSSFTLAAGGVPGTVMSFGTMGATSSGPVVLMYAFGLGAFSGTNPFTGTVVTSGLSSFGFTVATIGSASAAGDFSYSTFVPAGAAGLVYVQALDGMSDTFSNIVGL